MSKNEREYLYNLYSANLSAYLPQFDDLFGCPLCLQLFDREALDRKELTLEHVIPGRLGGKLKTLTCRKCNNKGGSSLEADLVNQIMVEDALRGVSSNPIRSTVRMGDAEITADVQFSEEGVLILGRPEYSKPEAPSATENALKGGLTTFKIEMDLGYNLLDSRVAVLKIGYLLAFSYFGYGYILHRNVQQVREQILKPRREILPHPAVAMLDNTPCKQFTIGLVELYQELRCFIAIISLSSASERYFGIILPGLDISSGQIYEKLRTLGQDVLKGDMPVKLITFDPESLLHPRNMGLPKWIWENL